MKNERAGAEGEKAYPHPIDLNALPHCDVFLENGYTKEEMKMVNETRKILEDDSIMCTATAVRVPVLGGHSESVNLEFEKDFELEDVRRILCPRERRQGEARGGQGGSPCHWDTPSLAATQRTMSHIAASARPASFVIGEET